MAGIRQLCIFLVVAENGDENAIPFLFRGRIIEKIQNCRLRAFTDLVFWISCATTLNLPINERLFLEIERNLTGWQARISQRIFEKAIPGNNSTPRFAVTRFFKSQDTQPEMSIDYGVTGRVGSHGFAVKTWQSECVALVEKSSVRFTSGEAYNSKFLFFKLNPSEIPVGIVREVHPINRR
jgi:hypothetical protein